MASNCSVAFVKCPDCEYISKSTGGLAVHRSKIHNINVSNNIKTLYINRLFPEGKPVYCCICDVVIGSVANFRRHMQNIHKSIELMESAQCLVCDKKFKTGRGAGVHLRMHNLDMITKFPQSPTPVMTSTDKDQTMSPSYRRRLKYTNSSQHRSASNSVAQSPKDEVHTEKSSVSIKTRSRKITQLEALVVLNDCTDVDSTITPVPMASLSVDTDSQCLDESYSPSQCDSVSSDDVHDSPGVNMVVNPPILVQPITPPESTSLNSTLNPTALLFTPTKHEESHPVEMIDLDPNCDDDDDEDIEHSSPNLVSSPFESDFEVNNINNTHNNNSSLNGEDPPLPSDIPSNPGPNIGNNSEFVNTWASRINSTDSFEAFSYQCEKFAEAVVEEAKSKTPNSTRPRQRPNRPNNREVNRNRPRVLPNPIAARRIQTLYRLSKKRAARQILNDNNTVYSGTKDQANEYFTTTFSSNPIDIEEVLESLNRHVPSADEDPSIMEPMSEKVIKDKLKNMSNSAPGKDRVEYRHLRQVDPNCKVLTSIFNRCLTQKQIPSAWKISTTILIYKKANSDDPSNFRPIALMSCLYKLFTAILASRATNFAINNNLMSNQQKSARPAEGCHEHTFTLQSIISDCKRNYKDCYITWLDLRNAFGSINHEAIYTSLSHMGFPISFIEIIKDIYTDSTTVVRTSREDETPPININAGVKQGCPISPILFNLTSELLIRSIISKCEDNPNIAYKLHNQPISILAYADDLVIISRTKEGLQDLLNEVTIAADVLNLAFRQDKCATLCLTCSHKQPSRVSEFEFTVQNGQIPVLKKEESYRYLGVPIGLIYDATDMKSITDRLISDLHKIRDSLLAPWQKLDAIRTFIQPGLTYALRSCPVSRESLKEYRSKLIQVLKSVCHLPKRASNAYLFADKSVGGLGFQDPYDERHIQTVVDTVKILSATDLLINNISRDQLTSVVKRCAKSKDNPSNKMIDDFLSGSQEGSLANHQNSSTTLWSRCRISCRALNISIHNATTNISVSMNDSTTESSKKICSFIHHQIKSKHANELLSLKDQGKVARCMQSCRINSTNNWSFDGTCVSVIGGSYIVLGLIHYQQIKTKAVGRIRVQSAVDVIVKTTPKLYPIYYVIANQT